VVEADPYGADLPLRVTCKGQALADRETVLTVATAARTGADPQLVARYAQPLNDQVAVVPGPVPAELAASVPGWEPLAAALVESTRPVMVDLGRVHAASPVLPVAAAAEVVVVVCRGEAASVIRLRERLARLVPALANARGAAPRVFPVVVTRGRYGPGDVADITRAMASTPAGPFMAGTGFIALDAAAVARLHAGEDPHGRLARTALLKSARDVAHQLRDTTTATAPATATTPATTGEAVPPGRLVDAVRRDDNLPGTAGGRRLHGGLASWAPPGLGTSSASPTRQSGV